ncbi:hypothetical protein HZB01_01010 [Candidatus Woesearchaeota archaeon]|nr:hypothetical protein [Candidatus Woesearchaeota archaeon]
MKTANETRNCISCNIPLEKAIVTYKGLAMEALQCPKCKEKTFTEEMTLKVVAQLEAKRLEKEYARKPIQIGNSWGITFPKKVVDVFGLNNPQSRIRMVPDVEHKRIEFLME